MALSLVFCRSLMLILLVVRVSAWRKMRNEKNWNHPIILKATNGFHVFGFSVCGARQKTFCLTSGFWVIGISRVVGKRSSSGLSQTPLQCVTPSAPRCRGFQFDGRILCRGRANDQSLRGHGGTFQGAAGS